MNWENEIFLESKICSLLSSSQKKERDDIKAMLASVFCSTHSYTKQPSVKLAGTKLSSVITTFVLRARKINASFVDLSLIQKALDGIALVTTVSPRNFVRTGLDPASTAYLLAVLAHGSLLHGDFEEQAAALWYQKMNSVLKPCYEDERVEAISAHLLIAEFCQLTALNREFKKHKGFARVLLTCSDRKFPDILKTIYCIVALRKQLMGLAVLQTEAFQFFRLRFSMSQEVFCEHFPTLQKYIKSQHQLNPANKTATDSEALEFLYRTFWAGKTAVSIMCSFTSNIFYRAVTGLDFSLTLTLKLLHEVKLLINFTSITLKYQREDWSLFIQFYMDQLDVLCCIYQQEFDRAKKQLSLIIEAMDLYQLCFFFTIDESFEHNLHLLGIALDFLGMYDEYSILQQKINGALQVSKKSSGYWPNNVYSISPLELQAICRKHSACEQLWWKLYTLFSEYG